MFAYLMRRLLHALFVIILVSMVVFLLMRLLPGDPIEMLVTSSVLTDAPEELIAELRRQHGLDRPLYEQYFNWLVNIVRGDFGVSLLHRFSIGSEMLHRMPITLTLGLSGFVIGLILGPTLGVICAIRRGKLIDNIMAFIANIGITAPQFWIGILLMYIFGFSLKWLPLYGYTLPWVDFSQSIQQGIMPMVCIALFPIASSSRQMRSAVIGVLQEDYIRTAWAKGLREKSVILRHVIKNSIMPVVTLQGMLLRNIVGGSVVVETVFAIPGMGKMLVDAMLAHDYPVVQGVVLIFVTVVVLSSLVVDLVYGWIDPRIQYE